MRRGLIVLAVAVVALGLWERVLARNAADERARRNRVGRLLSADERAALPRGTPIRIEVPGQGTFTYAPVRGRWRCLEHREAPADGEAILRLVAMLAEAEGIAHTADVARAPAYGINVPETVRVSLLDPRSGDVLFGFDVGDAIPGRPGTQRCFVRRRGTKEIRAIDADPHAVLAPRPAPGLPPLLEPGLVPRSWPGWRAGGITRVVVEREGLRTELARRDLAPDPERMRAGEPPWSWILNPGPGERAVPVETADAYVAVLAQASYVAVLDPTRRVELGLDRSPAAVTLWSPAGDSVRLKVGAPLADGRVPVWVGASETLYAAPGDVAALLAPEPSLLERELEESPWAAWLRR